MPFHDITGHERPIASIKAALRHGRLAHAYLFHGEAHIGKALTAMRLAQALNCERPYPADDQDSCGLCRSCVQIIARTHPDFVVIEPDQELAVPQIKIEQVRDLEQQFIYRPLMGDESWAKADRGVEVLTWLRRWIRDLVIVLVGGDREHLLHLDQVEQLHRYAQQADTGLLLDLLNEIERTEQQATRHLNVHMALETILLRLRNALGLARTEVST
ncbi:MAG: hypothetical protein HP477_03295 [Nitrospira sp.]|nr:hypothetical protein [Nitrospira sp.]